MPKKKKMEKASREYLGCVYFDMLINSPQKEEATKQNITSLAYSTVKKREREEHSPPPCLQTPSSYKLRNLFIVVKVFFSNIDLHLR